MESLCYLVEDGINLRKFILVSLCIARLVKDLKRFFSEQVDLAFTCCDHSLHIFVVDFIDVCDAMVAMLANRAPEAHSDLAVAAVALHVFARVLPTGLVTPTLASALH